MKKIYMDNIHRIFLIIIVVVVAYLFFSFLFQLASPQPATMYEMMQKVMGYQNSIPNAIATVLALIIGFVLSLSIKTSGKEKIIKKYDKGYALRIVKRKLSEDEKKLLKEIEKSEKITQDSLRARLGWSKAKISTILTRLDKMNLIQRERAGKTYNIFLSNDLK